MLSLAYITVEGAAPGAQIDAAARAGFDAVGLRAVQPIGRPLAHPLLGDAARISATAAALAASGVSVLDLEVLTLTPAFSVAAALPFLDLAATLRVREIQVVCEDADLDRAADRLAQLAEAAAQRGLGTALEFMAFRTVDTLETALRVAAGGRARILVDALHLMRSGGTIAGLAAAPADKIAFFQLCDAPATLVATDLIAEARFARLYPGEGGLPLAEMLAVLPAGLPISLEVPHATMIGQPAHLQAEAAMAWTRSFQARLHLPE